MKIYLDMVGCRLNQSEIEIYARQFKAAGHELTADPGDADLAVINTCTVTAAADSDSRQKIRQAARAGIHQIAVTGCWSSLHPKQAAAFPSVSHVIHNSDKDHLVFDILNIPLDEFDLEPIIRQPIPGARLRTRGFIKVQDGCDNRCTFCITTLARGFGQSRSIKEVLEDVHAALHEGPGFSQSGNHYHGAKEIVLTGVHLGSWGQDFNPPLHLRNLIEAIIKDTDTPRLRLSSLEPWDLDEAFFSLWENPRLCRHLHLPLQSGSAATLRRMARKTTPQSFAALVNKARAIVPQMAITTDLIAGFPGETEAEFLDTLSFIQEMQFSGGHVFTYSPRPGTSAASMPDQVPHPIRKERNAQLRACLADSARKYRSLFLGHTMPVLWESASSFGPELWHLSGLTDNYLRVNADAPRHMWNQITSVKITSITDQGVQGSFQASVSN